MIFIIDDDASIRRAYKNLLNSAGFDCKSFETADEFLVHTNLTATDFIILDIKMPGMNGSDLLKELAARAIKIPIIIVSAFINNSVQKDAKDYGAVAVMRKPIDGEALIDLIKFHYRKEIASTKK